MQVVLEQPQMWSKKYIVYTRVSEMAILRKKFVRLWIGCHCEKSCSAYFSFQTNKARSVKNSKCNFRKVYIVKTWEYNYIYVRNYSRKDL